MGGMDQGRLLRPKHPAWMAISSVAAVLAIGAATGARASQGAPGSALPEVQRLGPQIGERVPDFTLTDQHGQPRPLASLMERNGLMLVFYRSADW